MQISTQSTIKKFIRQVCSPWNSIPLIDRWLIAQILPPMLFAISAFTVISLSVGVMFDLIRKIVEFGLPLFLAVKVLFYSMPSFLVLSFPMAVLLSTLLAYGKLSANSELLALKSLGIKTSRIIAPAIAVSIFMTGLTFYFNDNLVPTSKKYAESIHEPYQENKILSFPSSLLKELPMPALKVDSANLLLAGTKLSLK